MMRLIPFVLLAACGTDSSPTTTSLTGTGTRWTEADALFTQEPRWLGGDASYSVELGNDTSLWIFGDSFIATSPALSRSQSRLVRNSIAVMTGRDPLTATMTFHWTDASPPTSYFPEHGENWSWPSAAVGLPDGTALVFLLELRPDETNGFGFAGDGYRVARVTAGAPPTFVDVPAAPAPFDATSAPSCAALDGDHVVALFTSGSAHAGRLARWPIAAPDLATPEWFTSDGWSTTGTATPVIPDGASECSLHRDPTTDLWVHTTSRGFGATDIAIRTAPSLEGPWSSATAIFSPPENDVAEPFVYAGKAHPQLAGEGLVVTYADSSFVFADLFEEGTTLYYPHFATLDLAAAP